METSASTVSLGGMHRRGTDFSLEIAGQQYIQQSVRYMLVAVILGVLGFIIATVPLLLRVTSGTLEGDLNKKFLPATVSELVSDWQSVEARIFFGFELCAAFCMLLSWYPFELRNAMCIPAQGGCRLGTGPFSVSWATFRQFVPPVGLLLVACVPTVPKKRWNPETLVLVAAHGASAMMMFAGFLASEAHALSIRPFKCHLPAVERDTSEYKARLLAWHAAFWPFACFLLLQVLSTVCPLGDWARISSFILEVLAGLCMLGNHLVVWYFAPERQWTRRGIVGHSQSFNHQASVSSIELAPQGNSP